MSSRLQLTLACGDYEITRALKDGTVKPDGIDLVVLTEMDSTTRHHRFLKTRDFDVAEVSSSSYLVARDQGLPFQAIPVFPHRRFRHAFVYINTAKGIKEPKDLIGRKVGVKAYQASAVLWLRGILEHEYGVPHRSIEWFSDLDEHVDFTPPPGLKLTRIPDDKSVETMLCEGELDALLHPDLIEPLVRKDPRVGRLFPNYRDEQIAYYKKTKIFPIMHVLGIKPEIAEKYPWVPHNLLNAFNKAKAIAMKRMENPRVVPLVLYREYWEEQEEIFGADPWQYGLTPMNRHNLETLVGYAHEQGLIKRKLPLEELFLNPSAGSKRDNVFRY
jgi:4,5-dihydroxyphthalate decarboxylase